MQTYTIPMERDGERRTATATTEDLWAIGWFSPGITETSRWLRLWAMAEED